MMERSGPINKIGVAAAFCAGLLVSSCAMVGPDYVQPEAPLPDGWQMSPAGLKATEYELVDTFPPVKMPDRAIPASTKLISVSAWYGKWIFGAVTGAVLNPLMPR